jgi:hypothetical protein
MLINIVLHFVNELELIHLIKIYNLRVINLLLLEFFKFLINICIFLLETSTFLTGIKVLIQQCQQANIRL